MKTNIKPIKAYEVALYFLYRARELGAGDTISNLKMQKLLYYAQGYFLALYKTPLFEDKIEAWKYGPVVKSIYDKFSEYGKLAIDFKELENYNGEVYTAEHLDFLPFIFNKYNSFSAWELSEKTHNEIWKDYFSEYNTNEIPIDKIQEFFTKKFADEAKAYLQ